MLLSFRQFLEEDWTRPRSSFDSRGHAAEHDEVHHQGIDSLKNKYKYQAALRNGRQETVPAYKFRQNKIGNTDAGSSRASSYQSLDRDKRERSNKAVGTNRAEMPIVTNRDHLLAGNTRASRASMLGKPTKVLRIKGH